MKAELILSRPSYQAGTPVVGTVRIRRAQTDNADASTATDNDARGRRPIRDEIVSVRLYLAGRAHLGSSARGKVSRWRSTQEVNQLKKIYGEHACLTMAKMEEQSSWSAWNCGSDGSSEQRALHSTNNGDNDGENAGDDRNVESKATFCKPIQPPQVTHIEQAERFAVHSCLHHSTSIKANTDRGTSNNDPNAQNEPINDYSHLPTPHEDNAICFWMTNVLELLNIPERHLDRTCACNTETCQCQLHLRPGRGKFYGDMHPFRPLQLPDLDVVRDVWKGIENKALHQDNAIEARQKEEETSMSSESTAKPSSQNEKSCEEERAKSAATMMATDSSLSPWERIVASANAGNDEWTNNIKAASDVPLEHRQLALSFRADLPPDVPPTMSAECVKYFYSAVLVVTTEEGELLVTQCPFSVLTSSSQHSSNRQSHQASTTRVHIGDLHAIAHSAGLPTYVSSTEASDATPSQLTVVANPPACDIVSRRTAEQRTSTHRIEDGKGCFCGLMTLIGIGGPLVPGTRLGIRVQFPIYEDDENDSGAGIIPCHRVCCALVGEEYAIFEADSAPTTANKGKTRVRTRSYVFDSTYEMVEFGYTEAISMGLVLPLDCPVTVKTDLVEVTVTLKVEFTVSRNAITSQGNDEGIEGGSQGEFSAIRMDLPCEVVHCDESSSCYREDGEEEERRVSSIRVMQQFWNDGKSDGSMPLVNTNQFDDTDIQHDLRMLSLRMLKL